MKSRRRVNSTVMLLALRQLPFRLNLAGKSFCPAAVGCRFNLARLQSLDAYRKGVDMKRLVLALTFLLVTCSVASAQFAQSTENLRGLKGVRLMVMLANYPHRLDEAQWPELLKMVQADAIAKLQEAGIP